MCVRSHERESPPNAHAWGVGRESVTIYDSKGITSFPKRHLTGDYQLCKLENYNYSHWEVRLCHES